jgi:hypothetical protein
MQEWHQVPQSVGEVLVLGMEGTTADEEAAEVGGGESEQNRSFLRIEK